MLEPIGHEVRDMGIVEFVVGDLVFLPVSDQPQLTQGAERMRDCRLGHPEGRGEVADTEFFAGECPHDTQSVGVAQGFEGLCQEHDRLGRPHGSPGSQDLPIVDGLDVAEIGEGPGAGNNHTTRSHEQVFI